MDISKAVVCCLAALDCIIMYYMCLFLSAEVLDVISLPKTPFFSRLSKNSLTKPVSWTV